MASVASFFIISICTFNLVGKTLTQKLVQSPAVHDIESLNVGVDKLIDVSTRQQRSPYDNDYDDYSDDSNSRHLNFGHKRKKHRKPLLLSLLGGHGGCRGHGCGEDHGWQPQNGGYNQGSHGGQGGSFASASAGSVGGSPHYGGGQSQANAQSASFSIGPYSATFSTAQASAGNRNDRIRDYYDY